MQSDASLYRCGLKYFYTKVICNDTESSACLLPLKGSQLSQMKQCSAHLGTPFYYLIVEGSDDLD